jgi:hypothetical protein
MGVEGVGVVEEIAEAIAEEIVEETAVVTRVAIAVEEIVADGGNGKSMKGTVCNQVLFSLSCSYRCALPIQVFVI